MQIASVESNVVVLIDQSTALDNFLCLCMSHRCGKSIAGVQMVIGVRYLGVPLLFHFFIIMISFESLDILSNLAGELT